MKPIERRIVALEERTKPVPTDADAHWPAFLATLTCDELRLLSAFGNRCRELDTEEVPDEYLQHAELMDIIDRSERFRANFVLR